MGNPFPITDLEFDSVPLQRDDLSVVLEIKRGLGGVPTVRGSDQIVPGRSGRIPRARVADVTAIELEGVLEGTGPDDASRRADLVALREEMRALFDGTKDPAPLSCVLEDGSTATIDVRVVPPILWDELPGYVVRVNVAMESVDPDWTVTPAGS